MFNSVDVCLYMFVGRILTHTFPDSGEYFTGGALMTSIILIILSSRFMMEKFKLLVYLRGHNCLYSNQFCSFLLGTTKLYA